MVLKVVCFKWRLTRRFVVLQEVVFGFVVFALHCGIFLVVKS
jgi:hypothetical protein